MHAATMERVPDKTKTAARVTVRRVEFDYLRTAVVLLVVWHHAILAYVTWAMVNPANPVETFSPVVDNVRWAGFDLMAGFNDTFFMPLMFFVSGLFVWSSLLHKGAWPYLRSRLLRLGIPFVVGALILMPLAYYPAQLTVERLYGGATGYLAFWSGMARAGFGTAGPLWFIWVLLLFDAVATLLYIAIRSPEAFMRGRTRAAFTRPLVFISVLFLLSTVAYLAMAVIFDPLRWMGIGPFDVQISRLLFYLVYFLLGTAAGAYGLQRGLMARDGVLARRWWLWLPAGLLAYAGLLVLVIGGATQPLLTALAFTLACALLVTAALALFLRFATRPVRFMDSLSANAYGIYIVHYIFVSWLQYWLLPAEWSAVVKALIVFTGALLLSWTTTAALRRIPVVARII